MNDKSLKMQSSFEIKSIGDLPVVAAAFLEQYPDDRLFAFYGSMGAGKTTLIKELCHALGSLDIVTSPTFTLVNEYVAASGGSIFHFDFYRINRLSEVFDFGIEEYFDGGRYCFMEWPELIEEILPDEVVKVRIVVNDDESRTLEIM